MRLLHIIDSLEVGGAERLLVDTINNLEGVEQHLITLSNKTALIGEIKHECKTAQLGFSGKKDAFRCISAIRQYIRKHKITVVHSHLVMANIFARLAAPQHVKVFNSLHNLNGEKFFTNWSWQRMMEKWTYKKRHHIIAVSNEVLEDYSKSIGLKGDATVLHNFVDDRFFAAGPRLATYGKELRTVAVGSFKPQKNYLFLIEVFKRLPSHITVDIYGDGSLRREIEAKISEYRLDNVRLCGVNFHIESVLRNYDLYLMCSVAEGHPIALLEAMASGMPALVSDLPVLREATENAGLYFNVADPDDMAEKLLAIADKKIDLDVIARHHFSFAGKTARKESYLQRLKELYSNSGTTHNDRKISNQKI